MKTFKAFAQIGPLSDNNTGVVAPIGEISTQALTYAREKTLHTKADYPNHLLIGFSHRNNGIIEPVGPITTDACLEISSWTYERSQAGVFDASISSFQQTFVQTFGDRFDLITVGPMVAYGTKYAPEWVEFSPYQQSSSQRWKVWFSNQAFLGQFDEYEILVIPPLADVAAFLDEYAVVNSYLQTVTTTEMVNRMNAAKGDYPYTILRSDQIDWVDAIDPLRKLPTHWMTVVYGVAGDNIDAIKEAIRQYVISHSSAGTEAWAAIFPDLFTSTEFIITPLWNRYAVPNQVRENGIHQAIAPVSEVLRLARACSHGAGYTPEHIDGVLSVVPSLHKSLQLAFVGGPMNRNGVKRFEDRYPDYINVPTTHIDFYRMGEETRRFVLVLSGLLAAAETVTASSPVPQGYNRIVRNDVVYVGTYFERFLYLAVTKASVDALG